MVNIGWEMKQGRGWLRRQGWELEACSNEPFCKRCCSGEFGAQEVQTLHRGKPLEPKLPTQRRGTVHNARSRAPNPQLPEALVR